MTHSPGFLKLVEEARARVREANTEALQGRRAPGGPGFTLIDVREDHEWQAGHIPGAVHMSKGVIERDIERLVPDPETEIWLYCGGGFRSALAADALQRMGYRNVTSVNGGYRAWVNAGLPVDKL